MAKLTGTSSDNELTGSALNDSFTASAGNDLLWGGAGTDRVIYAQSADRYTIKYLNGAVYIVKPDGSVDELHDIEQVQFGSQLFQLTEEHLSEFTGDTRPLALSKTSAGVSFFLSTSLTMDDALTLDILGADLHTKVRIDLAPDFSVYGANAKELPSGQTLVAFGGENKLTLGRVDGNLSYTEIATLNVSYADTIARGGFYNGLDILQADDTAIVIAMATPNVQIVTIDPQSWAVTQTLATGVSGAMSIALSNGLYALVGESQLTLLNPTTQASTTVSLQNQAYDTQTSFSVADLGDGRVVVSWIGIKNVEVASTEPYTYSTGSQFYRQDGYVNAAVIGSDSTVAGTFQVNEDPENNALWTDVCITSDGNIAIVWASNADGSGSGVYGRVFDADGNAQTDTFQVNSRTFDNQTRPQLAADDEGGFTVYWNDTYYGGAFQRFDAQGQPRLISITGTSKADILFADDGDQQIFGGKGNDQLSAGDGDDILFGGSGNDILKPGEGDDIVSGGSGTNTASYADVGLAIELNLEEGTVRFDAFTQSLTGIQKVIATALDDDLTGSGSSDVIYGGEGNDSLRGLAGDDQLYGGGGADTLDGGLGKDTLTGGEGDDVYIVNSLGDQVVEKVGQGLDTIHTTLAQYSLAKLSAMEVLVYLGSSAATLTGNALANQLSGGSGNDTLDGSFGADTLAGGAGNDTYKVDHAGDRVTENADQGTDLVEATVSHTLGSHVEQLRLKGSAAINGTGNNLANLIVGNGKSNTLSGEGGDDTLDGGAGKDTLTGGDGADQFRFGTALGSSNVDVVTDFVSGTDRIVLDDAIFKKLAGIAGPISTSNLICGTSSTTKAATTSQYLVFHTDTGHLYYDADGKGSSAGMVKVVTLTGVSELSPTDIWVV